LHAQEVIPAPAKHVMPVGKAQKHETYACSIGATQLIRCRIQKVAAQGAKNIKLIPLLQSQYQASAVCRSTLDHNIDAVEFRRIRELAAAGIGCKGEYVVPGEIATSEEIKRV
jgi:hypothetical protein